MKLSQFDYHLPPELIAQHPVFPRDSSRLMVLDRKDKKIVHRVFSDLVDLLGPGDVLVANKSKVIPARFFGLKKDNQAKVEILLVKALDEQHWKIIGKPTKRLRVGSKIRFTSPRMKSRDFLEGKIVEKDHEGMLTIRFNCRGAELSRKIHLYGEMPTPPYIKKRLRKPELYQTIYAEKEGSIAAPTAGLHFTPELIKILKKKGVKFEFVDLHVGLGTFLPVREEEVEDHKMHREYFELSKGVARRLNRYKKEGRRIIAVGTTSVRVLESCAKEDDKGDFFLRAKKGETNIFIYPGHGFHFIDALVTNFHLPKSTLLMLIMAFGGEELAKRAYQKAVTEKYRFYSFGDAMLIF